MLFKSTPLLLLGLSLQTSFAALVNLRLPVDGKWANFVKDTAPAATGSGPALDGWLIYPEGSAGAPNKPWTLRNRVALQLDDPADAPFIESDYGLTSGAPAPGTGGSGWWIFEAASPAALVDISAALMEDTRLNQVHFLLYRQMKRRFLPNDTLFTQQWHLRNTGQGGGTAGLDVNVVPVWDAWKGTGKRIAIVDDGLQTSHPDLAPNVDTVNDHDWNDATPDDPSPDITVDHHGTSCAGVAAARGNNGLGVSGAAPEATLVGLRLIAGNVSDAEEAAALGARFVHYSTDYVYNGAKDGRWVETDAPDPLSVYGRTKLEGEQSIAASGCRHLIFRTSWVYADRGHNFLKTILRLARERESLSIVADQTGVPTSAALLARVAAEALVRCSGPEPARPESGIYHLCPAGLTSWHDYARFIVAEAIAAGAPLRATVESVLPIPSSAYPTPARRPANSQLDTSKLRRALGCPLPPWEDDVRVALRAILSSSPSEEPASR
jgi:dTDP-4-dehydrorhamnose reductase